MGFQVIGTRVGSLDPYNARKKRIESHVKRLLGKA